MGKDAVCVFLVSAVPGVVLCFIHFGIAIVYSISVVGAFLVYVIELQNKKD